MLTFRVTFFDGHSEVTDGWPSDLILADMTKVFKEFLGPDVMSVEILSYTPSS